MKMDFITSGPLFMFLLPRGIGVPCLFLAVPWVGLWSVIEVYPDHADHFYVQN